MNQTKQQLLIQNEIIKFIDNKSINRISTTDFKIYFKKIYNIDIRSTPIIKAFEHLHKRKIIFHCNNNGDEMIKLKKIYPGRKFKHFALVLRRPNEATLLNVNQVLSQMNNNNNNNNNNTSNTNVATSNILKIIKLKDLSLSEALHQIKHFMRSKEIKSIEIDEQNILKLKLKDTSLVEICND